MHALYNLKDLLCKELEELGEKGELTTGSLETIDKLAHAVKNIDKIIMCKEDEMMGGSFDGGSYEGGSSRGRSYDDGSYRGSYRGGYSQNGSMYPRSNNEYSGRRGRDSMGRYTSRDGYSRAENLVQQLRTLIDQAPDERTRRDLQSIAEQMEQHK